MRNEHGTPAWKRVGIREEPLTTSSTGSWLTEDCDLAGWNSELAWMPIQAIRLKIAA